MKYVVTNEELSDIISNQTCSDSLLLVDTRPFADYVKGHIPEAVNIDLMQYHWVDCSESGIRQFNQQARILLSNIGAEYNKTVVFYDETSGPSPARGVWLLTYFSHRQAYILNGGYHAWRRNQNQIEYVNNSYRPSNFKPRIDSGVLANLGLVKSCLKSGSTRIIDSRSRSEYNGSISRAARTGHIPSAINIDWALNLDKDGFFKNLTQLRKIYSSVPLDERVITYCQGGYRAANTFLVLKMLGYRDVRMYLGSWAEWGNSLDVPVEGTVDPR